MPYQFNRRCRIERENFYNDAGGGYTVTGSNTIISPDEPCRLDSYMPSIFLTKIQGQEIEKTFTLFLHTNWQHPLDVRGQDIIVITFPLHDPFYNKRFRVRGPSEEAQHPTDPRGILELTLTRIDQSRTSDSI